LLSFTFGVLNYDSSKLSSNTLYISNSSISEILKENLIDIRNDEIVEALNKQSNRGFLVNNLTTEELREMILDSKNHHV
jgi:hypothetical protein